MSRLSKMVNYTPDYLTDIHGYVEVQGFGKDRIFKIKDDKLDALMDWNMFVFQTSLFIWDNVPRQWAIIPIEKMFDGGMPCNVTGEYPEGKRWMGWTADYLDVDWKPYGTI